MTESGGAGAPAPDKAESGGAVATLTIDRPGRRNALDAETCGQLTRQLLEAAAEGCRAIVLAGAGPHFCAGADLTSVHDHSFRQSLRGLLDTIGALPVPVIAAVQGAALGAGTQLAIACDLRVVAPTARFGIPAAKLGLMVDHWTVQRLALLAGAGPARGMLLAAEELDADAALRLGLAQRAGDLTAAQAWAADIADLAPLTIAGHKLALNRLERDMTEHADVIEAQRRAWSSDDLAEGMAAYRDRRPPRFEGH
jgi:enoyl-CoA hydratase